jgi:hypothetical protein
MLRNRQHPLFVMSLYTFIGALLLGGGNAAADGAGNTATLPLTEVLRLYKENQAKGEPKEVRPPVSGAVGKLELTGRLLEGAIDVTAHVELNVLSTQDWVTVRLLRKDAATRITRLPTVEHGVFSVAAGYLCFITDKPGAYSFDLGFLTSAQVTGARRKAEIAYPDAALAVLKVRFDEHLFALGNADRIEEGDGYTLYPQSNSFAVTWERNPRAAAAPKAANHRPPVEPIITAAHASVVSTLEGRRIARLLYELRFEGARTIAFTIPPRQTVEKVFVNGASVPFKMVDRTINLPVSPARSGDESARLELFIREDQGGYALSGRLDYNFPAASWNINDLYVTLNLPQVYNYQWEGGSLAPVESTPDAEYTQRIPTPGKGIKLHQQLLSSAATARIAYTVDLSGSYYRGEGTRAAAVEVRDRSRD